MFIWVSDQPNLKIQAVRTYWSLVQWPFEIAMKLNECYLQLVLEVLAIAPPSGHYTTYQLASHKQSQWDSW